MLSKFIFDNTAVGTNGLVNYSNIRGGVTFEHNINPNADLDVGTVASAKIEFVIDKTSWNTSITMPAVGYTFSWYLKQQDDNDFPNTPYAKFIVDKIEKEANDRYKITAYDYVSLLDKDIRSWIMAADGQGVPTNYRTVSALYTGICGQCGLSYESASFTNSDIAINKIIFGGNTISARTIMSYIAAVAGGYIVANASGQLCIKHFKLNSDTADVSLDYSKYKSAISTDYNAPAIQKIKVGNANESEIGIVVPDQPAGDSALIIPYNAIFYNEDLNEAKTKIGNIWNIVRYYSYRPMTIELFKDYGIKIGDKLSVTIFNHNDNTSNTYTTYVFSKVITDTGITLKSTGNSTRDLNTDLGNEEVQQMVGKIHTLTVDVNGVKSDVQDLQTQAHKTLTWDANTGLVVCDAVSGNVVSINGNNINAPTINVHDLNMSGGIAWGEFSADAKQQIASQSGGVPDYITSTYINFDSVTSPYIVGHDIKVRNGKFRVTDTTGQTTYGYIGLGSEVDASGTTQTGLVVSNSADTAYAIFTSNGVRLDFHSGNNSYSILLRSNGGYYIENGTEVKLGAARFS